MQNNQVEQSANRDPTGDTEDYGRECRDMILNLLERVWWIQDELITHIELHGPRVVVALREENEVRNNLKILMDDKVKEKMEFIEKLTLRMKKYSCFDTFMGADIRQSILNDLKNLQNDNIEVEDIKKLKPPIF